MHLAELKTIVFAVISSDYRSHALILHALRPTLYRQSCDTVDARSHVRVASTIYSSLAYGRSSPDCRSAYINAYHGCALRGINFLRIPLSIGIVMSKDPNQIGITNIATTALHTQLLINHMHLYSYRA